MGMNLKRLFRRLNYYGIHYSLEYFDDIPELIFSTVPHIRDGEGVDEDHAFCRDVMLRVSTKREAEARGRPTPLKK